MNLHLEQTIHEILYGYTKRQSISDTAGEKDAEEFFLSYFAGLPYFQKNPDNFGAFPIAGDPHGRSAVFAMVQGSGDGTVVLMHHHDVVTVEDFKLLKDYAFSPDELEEKLMLIRETLADDAREDLESGEWLFGRGVCDMKGGGAIQMALLTAYSQKENFKGNVIVLSVPDEENLSAGMRAGVVLLSQLKKKYGLQYRMMINSEPHQRKTREEGVFSFGSIGKMMPYVYVRGYLAHAGKVFEGLNPSNIMAEIVRRTEINMEFSDTVGNEAAPPPTWLYLRENKISYDVSMPLTIRGCLSVLTLNQTPQQVMSRLKTTCQEAMGTVIDEMNQNYRVFSQARGQEPKTLPWKVNVCEFGDLYQEAAASHGRTFVNAYQEKLREITEKVRTGEASLLMSNFDLVDFIYDYIDDLMPRVVIGLTPPYYPNVANTVSQFADDPMVAGMYDWLNDYVRKEYGQNYISENYYTGISDLSYSSMNTKEEVIDSLKKTMPFFETAYALPLGAIEDISMPCVNIGPWGKDFHKLTERVCKEDLYVVTPDLLDFAVRKILEQL